jgi:hypothetical protein
LGKALKPIVHPLRADIPIMLGAEGPRTWRWPPSGSTKVSPARRATKPRGLRDLRHRPGRRHRRTRRHFEMSKPFLALYTGGMGSEDANFHAEVYRRMGYAEVVEDVTKLFRSGRKDEAATGGDSR